jgi:hypothetical protein
MKTSMKLTALVAVASIGTVGVVATADAATAKNVPAKCPAGTVRTNHVKTVHGKRIKGCVKVAVKTTPVPTIVTGPVGPVGDVGQAGPVGPAGTNGAAGSNGSNGANGSTGATGAPGTPAPTSLPNWKQIARNTEGNGTAILQPNGLNISTGTSTDKVEFGDDVDFAGQALPDTVSASVFITGEDLATYSLNAPNVTMEINPGTLAAPQNGATGSGTFGYSSLNSVITPATTLTPNAINVLGGEDRFYLTGGAGTASGCNQTTYCAMAQVKAAFPAAKISLSAGLNKGKDYAFHGYATSLSIGGTTVYFHHSVVSATP